GPATLPGNPAGAPIGDIDSQSRDLTQRDKAKEFAQKLDPKPANIEEATLAVMAYAHAWLDSRHALDDLIVALARSIPCDGLDPSDCNKFTAFVKKALP